MAAIVVLSGSPSATSRTAALTEHLAERLELEGHRTALVRVRDLPADALIGADAGHPEIAEVITKIHEADGLVVASPIYKAAYAGVLKAFLDLLPHLAFAGKVVLPLLTRAGQVHSLALDYALRPPHRAAPRPSTACSPGAAPRIPARQAARPAPRPAGGVPTPRDAADPRSTRKPRSSPASGRGQGIPSRGPRPPSRSPCSAGR